MRRLVVLLLLIPLATHADTRVGLHAAGGIEGGMIRDPHPEPVGEAGLFVEHTFAGRTWGPAASYERIGRGYDDVADEWKLDLGVCGVNREHTGYMMFGVGIRSLVLQDDNHLPATIHGFDLIRVSGAVQISRRGPIALEFTMGWTLGLYRGRQYDERVGDMPQTSREVTALTTAYTLGLQTSFTLR